MQVSRAVAFLLALGTLDAQNSTFRSTTSLVRIDVEAIDSNRHVVANITPSDFIVFDQNQPQAIRSFAFEEDPLDLILLFDTSSGMRGKLQSIIRATELGFHELHKGDRVSVMAYDYPRVVQPFTPNLEVVNDSILIRVLAAPFAGGAHIEQAASAAALRFRDESASHRKRAILAITDKTESGTATAAIHELWRSNAVLSELIVGKGGPTRRMDNGAHTIAGATGGVSIAAGVPGEAFQESVHYLRSGYTLYYPLPDAQPGAERTVRVELSPEASRRYPGVQLRSRSGYLVQ